MANTPLNLSEDKQAISIHIKFRSRFLRFALCKICAVFVGEG